MDKTFEKLVEPVKELNDLTLKNIEQLAAIQVKTIKENTKLSVDSLKSANDIKDFDTLQSYLQSQIDVAQELSKSLEEDAKEMISLSQSYANEVKELVEKSIKNI